MRKTIITPGEKFGRLLVLGEGPVVTRGRRKWLCRCDCGTEKLVEYYSLTSGRTQSCGCLNAELKKGRHGIHNALWKGGRFKTGEGYIRVKNPTHPRADVSGYVLEHILIMEQKLGHHIDKCFTIHHLNGIKLDNRVDNLEIRLGAHGPGHTITDTLVQMLKLYTKDQLINMINEIEK